MANTVLQQFVSDPEKLRLFQQERLAVEVAELMCKSMQEERVTRSQLAERLHKTKGRISQILGGDSNLTLRSVADVLTALGKKLSVRTEDMHLEESASSVRIMDIEPKFLGVLSCVDAAIVSAEQALGMGA